MPEPNDSLLPAGVELRDKAGKVSLSTAFSALLIASRSEYDWPAGTGSKDSQQRVIDLENNVAECMTGLTTEGANFIFREVSKWASNNTNSHALIVNANEDAKRMMLHSLNLVRTSLTQNQGLDALSEIPGINLVIASKIFRFTSPHVAAAVDRHASYFFNSLTVVSSIVAPRKATCFKREWTTGRHSSSRLATFTPGYYRQNRQHYVDVYLPLLATIANILNSTNLQYTCAVTGKNKDWRPTDVEMAAYYWWATNGAR